VEVQRSLPQCQSKSVENLGEQDTREEPLQPLGAGIGSKQRLSIDFSKFPLEIKA
jgi:hypothetical protein